MEPEAIRSKLTWSYFSEKLEKLISDQLDANNVEVRKIGAIRENLKAFMHKNEIINPEFWGYGVNILSNGIQTIKQDQHKEAGFLLTLFTLDGDCLRFYFLKLNYRNTRPSNFLPSIKLNLKFIKKVKHSTALVYNGPGSIQSRKAIVHIHSMQLDRPLCIEADINQHGLYYAQVIDELKGKPNKQNQDRKRPGAPVDYILPQRPHVIRRIRTKINYYFWKPPSLGVQIIAALIALGIFFLSLNAIFHFF